MINVTLTFSGVAELLEFFTTVQAPASGVKVVPAAVEVGPAPAPKPSKPAKTPAPAPALEVAPPQATAAPTEAPAPAAAPAPADPEPAPAEPTVDYASLQKAVLALYSKDRAKAAGIATDMGYASFKVMPAERWAEALALVNAALAS